MKSYTESDFETIIDTSIKYQTIRGFGGMEDSKETINILDTKQINKVFKNGDGDLGFSILRIPVNENTSKWGHCVMTAKKASSLGALIFASPWNPPESMQEKLNTGIRLKYDKYGDYAQHLNNFVKYMKERGIQLYAISIQSEPDDPKGTRWTYKECVNFIANYADKIDCKVMSCESLAYRREYYLGILNNSKANANIALFGTHYYGSRNERRSVMDFSLLEKDPRDIWMTEDNIPINDLDLLDRWPTALDVGINIHNALVVGRMNAYVWGNIKNGAIKKNGEISKIGYMFAHFSKFIRPGAVRVDCTESPLDTVYISAYLNTDGTLVIVAICNRNSYSKKYIVKGMNIKSVTRYQTSIRENLVVTKIEISNNSFFL